MTAFRLAATLAALTLAAAPGAFAAPAASAPAAPKPAAVTVTGFNQSQISGYDAQGNPLPAKLPASAFKFPLSATEGPGGTIVLTYEGKPVSVHKLDVKLTSPPDCVQVADSAARSAGTLNAGELMGSGPSQNCKVTP